MAECSGATVERYAEDNSYASFRQAMQQWLRTDPHELDAMTQRAHQRFSAHFTDVIAADRYRSLFERVG